MNDPHFYIENLLTIHKRWDDEGVKIFGNPYPVYDFMSAHGIEFTGAVKPARYQWGYRGMCFRNAWSLALRSSRLTYVEGYATTGFMAVHHAWCIDENNNVVDTTWNPYAIARDDRREDADPTKWEYFGVPIRVDVLNSWMRQKPTMSVLYDFTYSQDFLAGDLTADEIIAKVAA